jgi:histidine ammonia-lyase
MSTPEVILDGSSLTAAAVVALSRYPKTKVSLSLAARRALGETRAYIDQHWMTDSAPMMYSFNTGVGALKSLRITPDLIPTFQRNLILAHSGGTGEAMPDETVRAMMALRANAFASNYSGVRLEVIDRMLDMLNHGITPQIAAKGSVGASGDLAPLAIMSGAMMGLPECKVRFCGEIMAAPQAFAQAGLPTEMQFLAKDASALINGSTASLAYAVLAAVDARHLLDTTTISLALTLEALRGELSSFEDRVQAARPHQGQRRVAAALMRLIGDSQRCTEPARQIKLWGTPGIKPEDIGTTHQPPLAPRIQDVYSLRCAPQVHGPVLDALDYIDGILATEINSATDNPLIFPEGDGYKIISGGHFHGQYIAQAMDLLAMVVTDLGAISDRRGARLIDPACNFGIPANLIAKLPGVNTGFSVVQSMSTGLVLENMNLCGAASVTSLPAKGNTEDHISNSSWAARRSRTVVENAQTIVAVELMLATQALDLIERDLKAWPLAKGTQLAWQQFRKVLPGALDGDRWVHDDIETARRLVVSGDFTRGVHQAVGSGL